MPKRGPDDLPTLIHQAQADEAQMDTGSDGKIGGDQGITDFKRWLNIAWAAGIIEGEGCITPGMRPNSFRLTLEMTDRDVVEPVGSTRTRIKKEEIAGQ